LLFLLLVAHPSFAQDSNGAVENHCWIDGSGTQNAVGNIPAGRALERLDHVKQIPRQD